MNLKHPCAQTCSGYKQAREETLREVEAYIKDWMPSIVLPGFWKHFGLDAEGEKE